MSSGGGGDAGGGGRAEWQRIYDRVEALAAGRARLEARNRIQHEFWDARDKINQSRLHQAELSRSRWEAACRELLPGDNPKLAELLESDLEDSRTCEALLDTENSELLVQLKEVGSCVELNENTKDHEHNSGDLISELRKLKRTYETLCSNKDKEATEAAQTIQQKIEDLQVAARKKDDEIGRLQAEASASTNKILVLEGKLNEMHSLDKANDIQKLKVGESKTLKRKFVSLSNIQSKEAGNCMEIIQENADHVAITGDLRAELTKLKQAYETLNSNKDKEISAPLAVEDFLLNKLLRIYKDNAGLLKIKEVEAAQDNESAQKLQQTVEELQVAVQYKDDEIGRLRAEAGPLKIKEVEAAQANKAVQTLQQNVGELQKAVRNKDKKIGKLRADAGLLVDMLNVEVQNRNARNYGFREEAASAGKWVLILEGKLQEMHSLVKEKNDEIQELKNGQPESLKCKCASSMPVKLEEGGCCIDLDENTIDHEYASGEIISELRKLKRANKDKEATEAAQKLQKNIEELQVAAQKKDDEFGRLQAEASASINKIPVLEGDIQKLNVGQPETRKRKFACINNEKRFQVRILGRTYHS